MIQACGIVQRLSSGASLASALFKWLDESVDEHLLERESTRLAS